MSLHNVTSDKLNDVMSFGHVIEVSPYGFITEPDPIVPEVVYVAPESTGDDHAEIKGQLPDGWDLIAGYSGQDRYKGPVFHQSEFIGGGLADDILATPGQYVALVVDVWPADDESESESAGWAVAYRHVDLRNDDARTMFAAFESAAVAAGHTPGWQTGAMMRELANRLSTGDVR